MTEPLEPPPHMTPEEFRQAGYAAIDWLVDHMEGVDQRPVTPATQPGDVRAALPATAPQTGEPFADLLADMDRIITPHLTQWQHPGFYGYFPANFSPPAVLGELLSAGLGVQGMLWSTGPAITELETHLLDWMIDLCGLPEKFLSTGPGGGVIQDSASSATLCAILAARHRAGGAAALPNLRAYTSAQAHSSAEKGCLVAGLAADQLRLIDTDENFAMNPQALSAAIAQDQSDGLVPFFVMATVGTTSSGAVDPLPKIAPLAKAAGAWLHVDAAWAGSAGVCPEYREIFTGLDQADSYVFNPHKWLLTNFDCSLFWVADAGPLTEALSIVPEYLRNPASEAGAVIDYRDWQVPLGRRFRSLKLWFVLRSYGVEGLQAHIRNHVAAAQVLAKQVAQHPQLELAAPPTLALVCFRHLDGDQASEDLLQALNATGEVLLTHTKLNDRYVLRVAVGATQTTQSHVQHLMDLIAEQLSS